MNTRRSRLSLVRRSESPKSPIDDHTRPSTSENNFSIDSGTSTPLNSRTRSNILKGSSPVSYESDHSPIPMSQDANNIVSGVSWAWNSPKRAIAKDRRIRIKPLSSNNQITYKDPESSRSYRKKASDKLTGFYRFQSELKLLQERAESTCEPFEIKKTLSSSSIQVVPPTSPPPSPDGNNLYKFKNANKKTSAKKQRRKSLIVKPSVSSNATDSFNNSDFDHLLLQASQGIDRDQSTSDTFEVKDTLSCSSTQVVPPTSPLSSPNGGKLQHEKNKMKILVKTQRCESINFKPKLNSEQSDSFNNSDLDNLLLKASQAIEQQLPKRPNLTPAQEQDQEKRRSIFKSRITDNLSSCSDDSFPELEMELLLQHVALPEITKTNSDSTIDDKDSENPTVSYSKTRSSFTRHKSMPESPGHNMVASRVSRSNNAKRNTDDTGAQSSISITSSSDGSVIFVPKENNVIVIASSSGGSSLASSTTTNAVRKCSKEEIEQKRQEALKRKASRLNRLMQRNYLQSESTFFETKLK